MSIMKKIVEKGNSYAAGEVSRIERMLGLLFAAIITCYCNYFLSLIYFVVL